MTDWVESLLPLIEVREVEVAFHKTRLFLEKVEIRDVVAPFLRLPLRASTIHMCHAKITKPDTFLAALEKTVRIAEILGCSRVVVHPSYGRLESGFQEAFFAERVDPLLEQASILLCWEIFPGRAGSCHKLRGLRPSARGTRYTPLAMIPATCANPRRRSSLTSSPMLESSSASISQTEANYNSISP